MSNPFDDPTPEQFERVRELTNRRLSPAEFDAYVHAPMSEEERPETKALIDWFMRRYPTPLARLRSNRRAWRNVSRRLPDAPG